MADLKRIIIAFCTTYIILIGVSVVFFKLTYPRIEYLALLVLCYLYLNASMYLGAHFTNNSKCKREEIIDKRIDVLVNLAYITCFTSIVASWVLIYNHYGDFTYFFINANSIRNSTIGQAESILPTFLSYSSSFIYAVWVYELAVWKDLKKPRYGRLILIFAMIFLVDLMSFGRVGLFFLMATAFCYFVDERKIFKWKTFFCIIGIFIVVMIPRLVRGNFDNFEGTISGYKPFLRFEIPEVINPILSIVPYFTGSFISGPMLISDNESSELYFGEKTFTPLFNLIYKLTNIERVSSIDDFVAIPYAHNVHGLLWDLYRDFGLYGYFVASIVLGFFLGYFSGIVHGRISNAAVYFVGGFLFYMPIYSLFSVGGFLISFLYILLLIIIKKIIITRVI